MFLYFSLKYLVKQLFLDFKFIAGMFVCLHFAELLLFVDTYDY